MAVFKLDNDEKFNIFSKDFWMRIVIMTIAICIVSLTSLADVPGGPLYALIAALIISILNAFLKPLLSLISMPLVLSTFGIFLLVINAVIVMLTSALLKPNFIVHGFWNAFFFSIIVTVLSFVMNIPRKIKKVQDHLFDNGQNNTYEEKHVKENNTQNRTSSNRFDNDPFNDDPNEKHYTDFEDVN